MGFEKWIKELLVCVAEIVEEYTVDQWRYGLAKEIYLRNLSGSIMTDEYEAERAVAAADALVAELKKRRGKE